MRRQIGKKPLPLAFERRRGGAQGFMPVKPQLFDKRFRRREGIQRIAEFSDL